MAEVKSTKKDQPMLDPIAYRSDYPEDNIIGPEGTTVELTQKYTGEGTDNVYHPYNSTMTIDQLDPNYQYGQPAKDINRIDDSYLSRRNDQIASALYNEGKVTKDDIVAFLQSQQNWFNSTPEDRATTTENIYNRIGQIGKDNNGNDMPDISIMEDALNKDTSGKIYGKTSANEGKAEKGINTLEDANSVDNSIMESRIADVKSLLSMTPEAIATAIWYGDLPTDLQSLSDYQQFYPGLYVLVQEHLNKLKGQNAINAITTGETDYATTEAESKNTLLENDKKTKAETYASSEEEAQNILNDLNNDLASNPSAVTAEDTMARLTDEMNKLKTRLKNLRNEANSAFKGDVPDYIVNAYINNRTQEINDRLKELQYDYDAAYQRNRDAIDDAWKWREYGLKQDQLNLQKEQEGFDQWYKKQTIKKSNIYTDKNGVSWELKESEDGSLYYEKIQQITQYDGSGMKGKGYKNNNPGNIKDKSFGNVIGTDDSGFAIFATPEDGFDALVEKIIFNQTSPNSKYYGTTIRQYFEKYAPKSDGNNPEAYANSVARQLGVSVDTPISKLDPVKFAAIIAKHDSGYDYSTYGQFRGGTSSKGKTINVDDIEIPDSIYIKDTGYSSQRVDPNSEEGQKLKQQYIDNYLKENGLTAKTENSNVPMTTVTLDSGESYQIPTSYYRYIYGPIPSRQKDSDLDNQRILEQILDLYNNGLSVTDALLTFNGINLNSDYADKARALFGHVMASGKDPAEGLNSSIAYNLTNGNDGLAVAAVENFVLPDEQKKEIVRISALAEKISDFIELTSDPTYTQYFGPYDSPVNTWLGKKVGNEKATKAYADLGNIYADIRQNLLGSQITEHEAEIYDPILAESSDNLNTVIQKLKSTLQNQMATYNAIRGQYGLPRLNMYADDFMNQVLYPDSRVGLYMDNNY